MMKEKWTLEAFENAGTKEIELEGRFVTIKAMDPKMLIVLFGDKKLDADKELSQAEMLEQIEVLDQIVINGLLEPKVTKDTVDRLGRFKQKLANEILSFSGLSEEKNKIADTFREESGSSNG